MSDAPHEDDIITQVVEKAAEKAAVAATSAPVCKSGMNRAEALASILVLIVLNVAALFLNIQVRSDERSHAKEARVRQEFILQQTRGLGCLLLVPTDQRSLDDAVKCQIDLVKLGK